MTLVATLGAGPARLRPRGARGPVSAPGVVTSENGFDTDPGRGRRRRSAKVPGREVYAVAPRPRQRVRQGRLGQRPPARGDAVLDVRRRRRLARRPRARRSSSRGYAAQATTSTIGSTLRADGRPTRREADARRSRRSRCGRRCRRSTRSSRKRHDQPGDVRRGVPALRRPVRVRQRDGRRSTQLEAALKGFPDVEAQHAGGVDRRPGRGHRHAARTCSTCCSPCRSSCRCSAWSTRWC